MNGMKRNTKIAIGGLVFVVLVIIIVSVSVSMSGAAPTTSSSVAPTYSAAPTTSSTTTTTTTTSSVAPTTSSVAPTLSSVAPTTSSAAPTLSSVAPTTSSVAPTTSSVAPTTSSVAPTTSSAAPTTSSAAPTTSSVAPTLSFSEIVFEIPPGKSQNWTGCIPNEQSAIDSTKTATFWGWHAIDACKYQFGKNWRPFDNSNPNVNCGLAKYGNNNEWNWKASYHCKEYTSVKSETCILQDSKSDDYRCQSLYGATAIGNTDPNNQKVDCGDLPGATRDDWWTYKYSCLVPV